MATTKELLEIGIKDFNKMTAKELRKTVQQMSNTANKRIKGLIKSGYISETQKERYADNRFTTKGKNLNELRSEYMRAKQFLESPTSTTKGAKQVLRETSDRLFNEVQRMTGKETEVSETRLKDFFDIYKEAYRKNPSIAERGMKYETMRYISQTMNDIDDPNEVLEKTLQVLSDNTLYENIQDEFERGGVSDFF